MGLILAPKHIDNVRNVCHEGYADSDRGSGYFYFVSHGLNSSRMGNGRRRYCGKMGLGRTYMSCGTEKRRVMKFHRCLEHEVAALTSDLVWDSLNEGGAFVTRESGKPFTFATGQQATLKLDAERLGAHPKIIDRLLGLYALHPCVLEADVLSFVPNGMADFAEELSRRVGKPLIRLTRQEGASRTDIRFMGQKDEALVRSADMVCAVEDISRTGLSAHAAAGVLRRVSPQLEVHTLSMLQRDTVDPTYEIGADRVVYHTFAHRQIPLELAEFQQEFPDVRVRTI